MSTKERSEGPQNSEPEVNSENRYMFREMIPYFMQVRAATPPMFSGVNLNISVHRWTSAMVHIFCDKRVPYSI